MCVCAWMSAIVRVQNQRHSSLCSKVKELHFHWLVQTLAASLRIWRSHINKWLTPTQSTSATWKMHRGPAFLSDGKHVWKCLYGQQLEKRGISFLFWTAASDKEIDNCFAAQDSFWWTSHYNLEMMDVSQIKPDVYMWLFRENERYKNASALFFAQWGVTVQSERF